MNAEMLGYLVDRRTVPAAPRKFGDFISVETTMRAPRESDLFNLGRTHDLSRSTLAAILRDQVERWMQRI